ncbi:SAM-dependent methyltransferase [Polaribacter reichenbachii]|uniref:SAM-dependent methyltransferase n=1 Tax=Polaribacter reichenbachii TaxID=996801 RepID=A0A1B8TW70_9FLAO|nr:tRNA (5-methylaminomethyl-2-thiouridine)(34)-methyltransferase MnmD [Polaribacter reichenbachii]APZ45178.1 SAM-dependent methyltransferase [Polaribacter reichenbachii]AUC19040.1 SAM-dependent methyltransferase [Polaribacter reichenbachii]OBY63804.1 SAM-dependent methyltransferase [Polaribacter reichenbachii]
MKREIIITSDGSTSIHLPDWNEQYHSKHGAIQEAYHVFINAGLEHFYDDFITNSDKKEDEISILEIGFGTGLNTFITFLEGKKKSLKVNYVGVEAYPVLDDEIEKLNYVSELKVKEYQPEFDKIHSVSWDKRHQISDTFKLTKRKQFFEHIEDENKIDLIYFDAFGATNQPELWTEAIFLKMFKALKKEGILTTYSAKGSVRRAMQAVGFTVERLAGPPGKREMLRATKK